MAEKRDILGLNPLYYFDGPMGRQYADSVLKLLKQGAPRRLSVKGLVSYMLSGSVQEPFTLIECVRSELPRIPADWLRLGKMDWTLDAAQRAVEDALINAVRATDCRDAFLSGGIDSGAIVALLRKAYPDDEIRTYCVIHEDPRTDERKWARMTAERNRTRHTEFLLTKELFRDNVAKALDSYDQPSLDGINNWFASKFVAEAGVKTILSGEGGDEVFVGYGQFAKPRQVYRYAKFFRLLPRFLGSVVTRLGSSEKIKKIGQAFGCDYDPYFLTRRQFDPDWIARLLSRDVLAGALPILKDLYDEMQDAVGTRSIDFGGDIINRCSWMEIRHNLLSMYVRDGVQTSRPFCLDIRAPILDEGVVRLAMSIPGILKCDPRVSKPLLVRAAGAGLPEECVFKRKQGFALPFDQYLHESIKDELDAFVRGPASGLFNAAEVERMWHAYLAGKTSWMRIWQCFVLDWWISKNKLKI